MIKGVNELLVDFAQGLMGQVVVPVAHGMGSRHEPHTIDMVRFVLELREPKTS